MSQFIHLSLLLAATILLPLVSVIPIKLREGTSVTFKFHQGCQVEECCRGQHCVPVNNCRLTINNLTLSDTGNYKCGHNPGRYNLHLTVTTDFPHNYQQSLAFSKNQSRRKLMCTRDDCRRLCTADCTCEYFTFDKENNECFLIPSGSLVIEENNNFLSGYPDSGVCNDENGFVNKCLNGLDFSKNQPLRELMSTPDDCRRLCTADCTCKYFTFDTRNKKCFLVPSGSCVRIRENQNFVSGYPDSSVCNGSDDAVGLQFHQQNKSWFEALKYCRDQHFSLVQITNSTMQLEVKSLLQNQSNSIQAGVWIGLERSMFGKYPIPWKWISGSEVGETDQWNRSFPVDSLNNHCGKIIRVNKTDFKWLDGWCHDELPFICQDAA